MTRSLIRRTLVGGALGGVLFGGVALLQALRAGAPFPRVLAPIGFFALLGLTIGALAGPLLAQAAARLRQRGGSRRP